ncbi:SS-A/Ro ribonucleoprotein [Prosthecobacter fusiformis]|uniref:SS-A/Ro ribonucleoprotein n=1 Tax=Prosthecobacter fusiformis TaxID=48464 RepID=A0A4R7SQB5_9BACT|nr:TROVE domain-containing protein [Prosthecobacter fusiformis]TDU81442.1 SS-A/Ro ribonucleoprotein [Prosthecobacter fusiformis]
MASKTLFQSIAGALAPKADTRNEAGGLAYQMTPRHALAQYAATGCLNHTYYATAEDQLQKILALCEKVPTDFIARTAIHCREKGFMKDVPALLCAVLAARDAERLELIFSRVINDAKMLRNFVQILRSGVTGRKSLGSLPKRLVRKWFENRSDEAVFRADVGQSPSMADIIKMVHPHPGSPSREALYGYLIGRAHQAEALPPLVREFEAWKLDPQGEPPDVPFQMLTALPLTTEQWLAIARRATWQTTRMNLNTFARHGVFTHSDVTRLIASRLRSEDQVRRARVFPYQLMAAYFNVGAEVPHEVKEALQDAMEIAVSNVPVVSGKVVVAPDVSGSMHSAVTGVRKGATSKIRCIDVAALVAAAFLRQNRDAEVLPFENNVVPVSLNPRDSVMTNAQKLASLPAGGTNCSAVLIDLNARKAKADLVIYVSDNESWMDTSIHGRFGGSPTRTMSEWNVFKQRNPNARLVCLDIQPYATTQAQEREDILNIGGFSDQVFEVIASFASGQLGPDHWVGEIENTAL